MSKLFAKSVIDTNIVKKITLVDSEMTKTPLVIGQLTKYLKHLGKNFKQCCFWQKVTKIQGPF